MQLVTSLPFGGKRFVDGKGYFVIYCPKHPTANGRRYIMEHRLVMESYLGRPLKSKEVVHHINGDKQDNRIENLMLFPNRAAHFQFQHFGEKTFICKYCGKSQNCGGTLL